MGARIIELSRVAAGRTGPGCAVTAADGSNGERFEFWTGASGRRYVHTVYSLIECPELPCATFVLVKRDRRNRRRVLRIGRAVHDAQSLNLAEIRHTGAKLGANEVHVHLLAKSERERQLVEFDLAAADRGRKATAVGN